ncbi:hypothetical protein HZH68_009238 [Vespula germanica]|uniref:Uncharacterized protein n=1 Tax=Vespula germanica TaxID=30212 RepID=A0A834JUZ6_VESGE|nr:hypothetical protein HZH68_009238 [Vespula germanica]
MYPMHGNIKRALIGVIESYEIPGGLVVRYNNLFNKTISNNRRALDWIWKIADEEFGLGEAPEHSRRHPEPCSYRVVHVDRTYLISSSNENEENSGNNSDGGETRWQYNMAVARVCTRITESRGFTAKYRPLYAVRKSIGVVVSPRLYQSALERTGYVRGRRL